MRVPSVQFLDPGVANVSWELHGMVSKHADSLSRQYQYYLHALQGLTVLPEELDHACGIAEYYL